MRPDVHYDVPSTAETMGIFFTDILVYALLAWYFDHIDESNRGKSYDKLFFLRPSYWFNLKTTPKLRILQNNSTTTSPKNGDFASEISPNQDKNTRNLSVNSYMNINGNTPEKLLNEQIAGLNEGGNNKNYF
jgi:hypothetical protein